METENHVSLDELRKSPAYLALTEEQQRWIEIFVTTGNIAEATSTVYAKACKKGGSGYVAQLSGKLRSSPRIRAALAFAFSWSESEQYLDELNANLKRAKGADRAGLLALKAKVLGLLPSDSILSADEKPTYAVGSLVEQNGQVFQITAVPIEVSR